MRLIKFGNEARQIWLTASCIDYIGVFDYFDPILIAPLFESNIDYLIKLISFDPVLIIPFDFSLFD